MANKNQTKNLTLSSLKQKNTKLYNEKFNIEIDGYILSVNKTWSPIRINKLIVEFTENLKIINADNFGNLSVSYMYLLLLRYFTSLTIPKELDKQLAWLNEIVDSGYLNEIVNQLPEDQIKLVEIELARATENMKRNLPIIQEELSKLNIENDEVKELMQPNPSDELGR